MGQIWIFNHFKKYSWTDNVLRHLKCIKETKTTEQKEILEIVPITSLCGKYSYNDLWGEGKLFYRYKHETFKGT